MLPFLEDVLDNIESQHCVVLLGPNVPQNSKGQLLKDAVFEFAQESISLSRDMDGLLSFDSGRDQTRYPNLYRRFTLKEASVSELHRKLADLPVHLYISLTPDHLLEDAFKDKGIPYEAQCYHKGRPQPPVRNEPSKDTPLIYNLFGSVHEPDSLVYTQDDLFDFLFSVMGPENPLPEKLLHAIHSARLFLFLGFEFDRWYLKLLLRLFNLHQNRIVLSAADLHPPQKVQAFYKDQFEMVFVSEEFNGYVNALHAQWPSRQPYRAQEQQELSLAERIKECMRLDQLEEGLDLLRQFLEGRSGSSKDSVVMLSGQYYGTLRQLDRGILAEEEANRSLAKIREGIIHLVNREA